MRIHSLPLPSFQLGRGKKLEAVHEVEAVRPSMRERTAFDQWGRYSDADRILEDVPQDLRVRKALHAYSSHRLGAEEAATLWYGVDVYV